MTLEEFEKIYKFPIGGFECANNIPYIFSEFVATDCRLLELTKREFSSFLVRYGDSISQETNVASGTFTFWGVTINKLDK